MKTEVGVRGFFYFFLLFSPLKRYQTTTIQVEDGEDGASAGEYPDVVEVAIRAFSILVSISREISYHARH